MPRVCAEYLAAVGGFFFFPNLYRMSGPALTRTELRDRQQRIEKRPAPRKVCSALRSLRLEYSSTLRHFTEQACACGCLFDGLNLSRSLCRPEALLLWRLSVFCFLFALCRAVRLNLFPMKPTKA